MRVVLTDDVADDARGLLVGAVPVVAELAHRMQHAAVHGLQPVAHVGQRAADDDAHRVVEIRLPHLVFEIDREDFLTDGHYVFPTGLAKKFGTFAQKKDPHSQPVRRRGHRERNATRLRFFG